MMTYEFLPLCAQLRGKKMAITDLKPQARNLLKTLLNKPFSETSFTKKLTPSVQSIITWCQQFEFEAGSAVGHNNYCFTRSTINKISETLLAHNFAPLNTEFANKTRTQVTKITNDEKSSGIKPKDNLVLVALTNDVVTHSIGQCFYQKTQIIGQINIELIVDNIDLAAFGQLIVIENRDSFNDWSCYQPQLIDAKNSLVIYRGDKGDATAAKKLRQRWQLEQSDKQTIYFGDFDLQGLSIAISGHYDLLMLPELRWLSENLINDHYPDKQLSALRGIKKRCPGKWQHLLLLMIKQQAGLRQQWMFETKLVYI
jgi:hypothetical protein